MADEITPEVIAAVREHKRKADEAYNLVRRLSGGKADAVAYAAQKERARARQLEQSLLGRDIGEIPPVQDEDLRQACTRDFRLFCDTHFRAAFSLPWCRDHLAVIAKIERAVLHGGLFAVAMPRGSGKTTLCQAASIWALLYGHRRFVAVIGAEAESAGETLAAVRVEIESNEMLLRQFPEAVYPITKLDGISQRRLLYKGRLIRTWSTASSLVLPDIQGSPSCQGVVRCTGLTGRIRGMRFQRTDGRNVRPDLVILDDPQTDESARSVAQCASREAIVTGAVLGLAGPGKKIAGIMPCTVIRPGDVADRLLNKDIAPEWQGERTKLVYQFPSNEKLWGEYREVLEESLRAGHGMDRATEFYRQHRAAMDAGAEVAWEHRFNPDEDSAIQHAMNLRFRDEAAFWSEYQNDPLAFVSGGFRELTAADIAAKVNRIERGNVPPECTALTAFVDVQQNILYYLVAAWAPDFSGAVVDYGTWPRQQRAFFTAKDAPHTLQRAMPGAGVEGCIFNGLEQLTVDLLGRSWRRLDGANIHVDRCLIDANWGQSTDVVYQFCLQSRHAAQVMPSHGKYVGAGSQSMGDWSRKPGDRAGLNWRIPNVQNRRAVRYCVYDTNYWKSFVQSRLAVAMGDRGCLSLFGTSEQEHHLLAAHLTAEYRVQTQGRGRTVDEWRQRPERPDNHWLDCLVGAAVAASIEGCAMRETEIVEKRRTKITAAELHARRAARG